MITWMQKNNRYLVWTIWVATIAFIGAGFVGWGSYKYGSKASAVGSVGDIEISNEKLNVTYQNLYNRYNEIFKGKFDEEQAKKMGLQKQAFDSLASQAQLLNLAKQYGIVVSEKELADYIAGMKGFQENGVFSRQVYNTYLQNRRMKVSTFESILTDELTIKKLLDLIEHPTVGLEQDTVASALRIEDKIAYTVLSPDATAVTLKEEEIKQAWEESKDSYLTPQKFSLELYWNDTKDVNITDQDIQEFYDKNSFNYINTDGSQRSFENAREDAAKDLRIKKGKKAALLDYIALKKGKKSFAEKKTLPVNDPILSSDVWKEIASSQVGTLLKPKVSGTRYVTVKFVEVIEPKPMPYDEAKKAVSDRLQQTKALEAMDQRAKDLLSHVDEASMTTSQFIRLTKPVALLPMSQAESVQFVDKLFTSSGKKGIIRLSKRQVVYKILEQRIAQADANVTSSVKNNTDQIKKRVFEEALFKKLNEQFPVKAFVKGL